MWVRLYFANSAILHMPKHYNFYVLQGKLGDKKHNVVHEVIVSDSWHLKMYKSI